MAGPWWAWASAGLSAAAKAKSAHDVEKKQSQLAEAMRQYGLVKAGEQDAATRGYISTITPEARAQQLSEARDATERSIASTVAEAVKAQPLEDFGGRVSQDYQRTRDAGRKVNEEAVKRAIQQLAVGASTGRLATADDVRLRRAAGDVGAASTAARSVGDQYMHAIRNVRPNAGLSMLGEIAGALATMGFAGGAAPAAAGNVSLAATPGVGFGGQGTAGLGLKVPTGPSVGLKGLSI